MKAIQFDAAIPRYAFGLALSKIYPPILWSGFACMRYRDVPEPHLPNDEWVVVKTRYGGICGSDAHLIHLHNSPSASALTSFPFTIGHENCGTIAEVGKGVKNFSTGDRVVVDPTLACQARGFKDLCQYCARGELQKCERVTRGTISAGLLTGACRDTGGSWSPFFLAHESQLVRVPDVISDENALMLEPFAVGLHAVLMNLPRDDDTVLVIGAGVIGLLVIAALRAVECRARIVVMARHSIQQQMARQFGADVIVPVSRANDYDETLAQIIGGKLHKPILGKPVLMGGGADVVFECVGSSDAINDALRFARPGGRAVMAGLASIPEKVDWTPVWLKELTIQGSYIYGYDNFQGKHWRTFDLGLEFMQNGKVDLTPMVTHKFALGDYARAFETISHRGKERAVKATFEFA